MTDGLNAVLSNDRAAPTDTNPKNLELAPPQSVTATRLDQLVYSPNCYIQIFQTQLFACSEDQTPNRSLEFKVPRVYRLPISTSAVFMGSSASHPVSPHCLGRVVSTQFAQQFVSAVTAPPLVGCVIWSL